MGNLGVSETSRILDVCREAGVTTLDTADVVFIRRRRRDPGRGADGPPRRLRARHKGLHRLGPGPHEVGLSRKHLIQACEASLRRLRTDYIDLYICHQPDMYVAVEETLRAFDDLVDQGKIRYIGCSNHSAWQVMKALAVSDRSGLTRYVCQQVNYSLIGRDIEHEIIPLGLDQSVGLMAWSPLHAGLLTGKFRRDARPAVSRLNELDAPGTIDYERVYRIVDVLDRHRAVARSNAVAGGAQLGPEQAGSGYGHPGGTRRDAAARQSGGSHVAALGRGNDPAGRRECAARAVSDVAPAQVRDRAEPASAFHPVIEPPPP